MEIQKKTISLDAAKRYDFPESGVVYYKDKILVIAKTTANWLVLDNQNQLDFYNILAENTVEESIEKFGKNKDSIGVLTQIEAKQFESTNVLKSTNGQKSMHLYLTNGCNLRCPHCYMHAGYKLDGELKTEDVLHLLDMFAFNGGKKLTLSGGEITTRADLLEIIDYAFSRKLSVRLLTNGTMWTKEMVQKVSSKIECVQISIDGFDEQSNSIVRGSGSFKKSLDTVDAFVRSNVKTEISIVPFYCDGLKYNKKKYVEFAKSLISKYKLFGLTIRFATELLDGRDLHTSIEQKTEYSKIVTDIYSMYYDEDMNDYPFVQQRKGKHILNNCMFGELAIAANGDVFPCAQVLNSKCIGNVTKDSFRDILEDLALAESLSEITNLKPCNSCELMYICGGGCRIKYFPDLLQKDVKELKECGVTPRKCTKEYKEQMYDIMIRTNHRIFQ